MAETNRPPRDLRGGRKSRKQASHSEVAVEARSSPPTAMEHVRPLLKRFVLSKQLTRHRLYNGRLVSFRGF
jgi:hypothetical protein